MFNMEKLCFGYGVELMMECFLVFYVIIVFVKIFWVVYLRDKVRNIGYC